VKFLIIVFILSAVGTLIYLRLRPYLAIARRLFSAVRTARHLNVNEQATAHATPHTPQTNEALVRCAACGTWTARSRALVFRATQSTYCSPDCFERSAASAGKKRASGHA
jgi:hypothetical protein